MLIGEEGKRCLDQESCLAWASGVTKLEGLFKSPTPLLPISLEKFNDFLEQVENQMLSDGIITKFHWPINQTTLIYSFNQHVFVECLPQASMGQGSGDAEQLRTVTSTPPIHPAQPKVPSHALPSIPTGLLMREQSALFPVTSIYSSFAPYWHFSRSKFFHLKKKKSPSPWVIEQCNSIKMSNVHVLWPYDSTWPACSMEIPVCIWQKWTGNTYMYVQNRIYVRE